MKGPSEIAVLNYLNKKAASLYIDFIFGAQNFGYCQRISESNVLPINKKVVLMKKRV